MCEHVPMCLWLKMEVIRPVGGLLVLPSQR